MYFIYFYFIKLKLFSELNISLKYCKMYCFDTVEKAWQFNLYEKSIYSPDLIKVVMRQHFGNLKYSVERTKGIRPLCFWESQKLVVCWQCFDRLMHTHVTKTVTKNDARVSNM